MAGKGSKPRPIEVDRQTYESNWDRIFNKNKNSTTARAVQEESYHKTFDYKDRSNLCQVCGESGNRHTYTCVHYDTEK